MTSCRLKKKTTYKTSKVLMCYIRLVIQLLYLVPYMGAHIGCMGVVGELFPFKF